MPKRISRKNKSEDFNQIAQRLVRESTTEKPGPKVLEPKATRSEISRVMSEMGRKGGRIGAKSRMVNMTPEQRSQIAANAARAMWAKKKARKG